ncbi:MAG TPA: glycosyl hydrolase [Ohtaekwangia sp.]|uniref:glycosyl hydrolase n=1 Tax=Ohtaekwangia sp. TaxID=2066019 RepID=UPI002F9418DD
MKNLSRITRGHVFLLILASLFTFSAYAQTVVPVGSGSYASAPLADEGQEVIDFTNLELNVPAGNTKPIPTNDWWTQVLLTQFAGNLWAYPIVIDPEAYGCEFFSLTRWSGRNPVLEYPVLVKGVGFTAEKNIAKNWTDWSLTINMPNGTKSLDVTIVQGSPMTWFEATGFDPITEFGSGVTFFNDAGTAVTLPYTSDHIGALYRGKYYGIYAPDNTQFTLTGNAVTLKNATYFTLAALTSPTDLAYYKTFAYSIPRDTKVNWSYLPEQGKVDVTWNVTTQNLKGLPENRIVQGFLPHHYKRTTQDFSFNGREYVSTRGTIKCGVGTSFKFSYDFNGVLPHLPSPSVQNIPYAYDPAKMDVLLGDYAQNNDNPGDTYWGGKVLVNAAKYTLIAKETNNPHFETFKTKTRALLQNWLTYTPGEASMYYARYDKWKALVGFNSSYGSSQFTDNHFHYGYLTYASAMLGMVDQDFLNQYGPMIKLVAKQYANWDRNDQNFPLFRTFNPWRGHSYAGGKSSSNGNNQESSSEAMQSWAGIFLMGNALGDNAMRDAGAFGYVTESRAIMEYWFDWDHENFPPSYGHTVGGIIYDGGIVYGTFFSGAPRHIHGIQYLPWGPFMNYAVRNKTAHWQEYTNLLTEEGNRDESTYGADWANVSLCFAQMSNPDYVAQKFHNYYINDSAVARGTPTAGQTYYYTHANRTLGDIQWNYHISIPSSTVYFNASTQVYSYVVYNPSSSAQTATVYKDGAAIGSFSVPSNTLVNVHNFDGTPPPSGDPVVQFTAPAANATVANTISINASAYDPDIATTNGSGISSVLFELISGNTVVTSLRENIKTYDWVLNTKLYPNGIYTLKATAASTAAAGGTTGSSSINITIANSAGGSPVVQFTRPAANATLSGTIAVNATAYDPDIATTDGSGIANVIFELLQNATVIASLQENIKPYDWSINTSLYPNGAYTLRATARSTTAAGGTSTSTVIPISIANGTSARITVESSGINDAEVYLHPNPVHQLLTLDLYGNSYTSIQLLNVQGQPLLSEPVNKRSSITWNVSYLKDGLYYIRLTGSTVRTIKIIKQ